MSEHLVESTLASTPSLLPLILTLVTFRCKKHWACLQTGSCQSFSTPEPYKDENILCPCNKWHIPYVWKSQHILKDAHKGFASGAFLPFLLSHPFLRVLFLKGASQRPSLRATNCAAPPACHEGHGRSSETARTGCGSCQLQGEFCVRMAWESSQREANADYLICIVSPRIWWISLLKGTWAKWLRQHQSRAQ